MFVGSVRAGHRRSLQRHGHERRSRTTRRASATARASSRSRGSAWPGTSTGDGKTALHASVGLSTTTRTSTRTGWTRWRRNPPAQNTPSIIYGTMDTLLAAGAQGAFANRPSDVFGIERDAQDARRATTTPSACSARSAGARCVDVTYAGFQMRQRRDGARHQLGAGRRAVRRHQPAERQPAEPDDRQADRVPAAVPRLPEHHHPLALRHCVTTTRCRCSSIAATSAACSSRSPTRSAKTVSDGTAQGIPTQNSVRWATRGTKVRHGSTQLHNLVINYTWDVPNGSRMWNHWLDARPARRLAALGRHGDRERRLVGREQHHHHRQRRLHRRRRWRRAAQTSAAMRLCTSGNCDPTPGEGGSYLNVAAFSRPADAATRQRAGARSSGCRRSSCRTCRSSRTSQLGGGRRIQFRWEAYNVFNQVNWSSINTNAQFNPAASRSTRTSARRQRPATRGSCRGRFGSHSDDVNS